MRVIKRLLLSFGLFGSLLTASAQLPLPPAHRQDEQVDDRLPNGKSRTLALLKADHEKSLEDVREIIKIAQQLEKELSEQTEHVLSLDSIEKASEIEDISKGLQKRLKRVH